MFFSGAILTLYHKVLFIMEKHEEQLAAIQEMRNLMDRATRFRTISGLSAIVAGLLAILCVLFVSQLTDVQWLESASFE